jgi:O-antigen ligase
VGIRCWVAVEPEEKPVAARIDPARSIWFGCLGLLAGLIGLLAGVSPKLALAAAIGAGFVLLVSADLAAGLAVFGFFSFLELLEIGGVVSVSKLGGGLLALGWLAALATRHDTRQNFFAAHPWASATLGLFVGWSLLSTSWAFDSGAAAGATARFALNAVLFLIVFTAVRTRRQALMVIAGFVAGAAAAAAYGLSLNATPEAGRLTTMGLDPNQLGSVLVAGVALAGALAVNARRAPGLRLAALGAGAFCLLGIFLTVSRGGLIALGIALVAAVAFSGRWRPRVLLVAILISATTFVYFETIASPEARERIGSTTEGETRVQNGRVTIWTIAWRMSKANPITGVGAGNFQESAKDYLLQPGVLDRTDQILLDVPAVAHNSYLSVLSELGVVGLALFLAIIIFSLVSALRAAQNFRIRGDPGGEALARGVAIALAGTLAADFFIAQELSKQLWLLMGFGPALLTMSRCRTEGA